LEAAVDIIALRKAMVAITPQMPRAAVPAVSEAVQTELPATSSVGAGSESEKSSFDSSSDANRLRQAADAMRDVIERRNVVDPRTREIVYQSLRSGTGEILLQIPDENLLKLRAYNKADEAEQKKVSQRGLTLKQEAGGRRLNFRRH
jgi:hypothetical protein